MRVDRTFSKSSPPRETSNKNKAGNWTLYFLDINEIHKNRDNEGENIAKNEEITEWEAQINTWKLTWYVLTFTKAFQQSEMLKRREKCENHSVG